MQSVFQVNTLVKDDARSKNVSNDALMISSCCRQECAPVHKILPPSLNVISCLRLNYPIQLYIQVPSNRLAFQDGYRRAKLSIPHFLSVSYRTAKTIHNLSHQGNRMKMSYK